MDLEDSEIIDQILAGHKDRFRILIERHQNKVFTLILRLVRDRETAQDLSQEVFLKIYRKLGDIKDRNRAGPWIMQVAHNSALDWLKKRRVDSFATDFDDHQTQQRMYAYLQDTNNPSPDEIVERMSPTLMSEIINKLDVKYRAVITLRFIEGYSFKEIAGILELPLSTVKFRKHYALQLIKDRWLQISGDGDS